MSLFSNGRAFHSLDAREQHRTTRSEGIRRLLFVSGVIMLCFVAFLGLTVVLLPMLDLRAAEQERDRRLMDLQATLAEEKRQRDICTALERDPEFNEAMARDKGLAHPDESVIHITPVKPNAAPVKPVKRAD